MAEAILLDADLRYLYREFNRVCCEFDQLYRNAAMRMGLSDSAFQILMGIYDLGEGCTQSQICDYVCLGKQTISSSVKNLKQQGLIELRRESGVRGAGLFLTTKGKRSIECCIAPVVDADVRSLSLLGKQEAEKLVELSRSYLNGFEAELSNVAFPDTDVSKER